MLGWRTSGDITQIDNGFRLVDAWMMRRGIIPKDYTVEATLIKRQEPKTGWAGLWVRQRGETFGNGALVNMYTDNWGVVQYVDHNIVARERFPVTEIFPIGRPTKLIVTVTNNKLKAEANGNVIETTLDPALIRGGIGLHSRQITTGFYNLKIPLSIIPSNWASLIVIPAPTVTGLGVVRFGKKG